jgi:hypothetical protein
MRYEAVYESDRFFQFIFRVYRQPLLFLFLQRLRQLLKNESEAKIL